MERQFIFWWMAIGVPAILAMIFMQIHAWRHWHPEQSNRLHRVLRLVITAFMMVLLGYVGWQMLPDINVGGAIFFLVFFWLILPCKHPADYRTYSLWWADRRNWFKNMI